MATEEPTINDTGNEHHPAFATAVVTSSQGTSRTLFQSDLQHTHTVNLSIHTATRKRSLNHDSVFPEQTITEIEMSLSQWGQLVSSMGAGSGTPVTLRRRESHPGPLPELPYQPRIQASVDEAKNVTTRLLTDISAAFDELDTAIESKAGIRVVRELRRKLEMTIANAPSNAAFAITSLSTAAENIVGQAGADIEARIASTSNLIGPGSASLPNPLSGSATQRSITDGDEPEANPHSTT